MNYGCNPKDAPRFTDVVLDIPGVLYTYSYPVQQQGLLSARTLKQILNSPHYRNYERGALSQKECYDRVVREFNVSLTAWKRSIQQFQSTFAPNNELIEAIRQMKSTFTHLRVHVFANLAQSDFDSLQIAVNGWDIFDSTTLSSTLGHRMPDFQSYRVLCDTKGLIAESTILVSEQPDHVFTGHLFGNRGIVFKDTLSAIAQLYNLLGDSVERGMAFLRANAGNLFCETDKGIIDRDNFSQLLILDCIGEREIVTLENEGGLWQFFIGDRVFVEKTFPKDADTTCLAHATLDLPRHERQEVIDAILANQTADNIPLVYFDPLKPRICPHVCANILRFFYMNGQGHKVAPTLRYLHLVLETRAYELETRYYFQQDWMFYHLAEMCAQCTNPELADLHTILTKRLEERVGRDRDVIGCALRVLASQLLCLPNDQDLTTLYRSQQLDGGWEFTRIWRYGTIPVEVGSRGVSTALAVRAIRGAREHTKGRGRRNEMSCVLL